jgi:hypothetical protein
MRWFTGKAAYSFSSYSVVPCGGASREAVQNVVEAIIKGDAAQYRTAIHRVELEGGSATLDRIDNIQIAGDTATVDGASTFKAFDRPPEVVASSNHAVREGGQW